jgi:hypothetical protein
MIEGKLLIGKHITNITWYILPFLSFACASLETQNINTGHWFQDFRSDCPNVSHDHFFLLLFSIHWDL